MSEDPIYYAEPPPGQVRVTVNPPTRRNDLMAAGIATTTIAALAFALRLYTRLRVIKKGLNVDDWLVTAAFVMSLAMLAFVKKDIDHGLTYHVWDILQSDYHIGERLYGLLAYLTFIWSVSLAKMSMLALYLRLSPHEWVRWSCSISILIVISYSITASLVESLACRPLRAIIDESMEAECYDSYPAYIALSSLNIIMDVVILLLPIPLVIQMQLPTRQKISLILLFATGILVCCVALKRVTYIPVLEASEDYDWDAVPDMILCFIEVNAGIVCASVPVVRPFFTRFLPVFLSSRKSSGLDLSTPNGIRVIHTVEQRNRERKNFKRRNVPQDDDSYDLSTLDDLSRSQGSSYQDDEESRLWPPAHLSYGRTRNKITAAAS